MVFKGVRAHWLRDVQKEAEDGRGQSADGCERSGANSRLLKLRKRQSAIATDGTDLKQRITKSDKEEEGKNETNTQNKKGKARDVRSDGPDRRNRARGERRRWPRLSWKTPRHRASERASPRVASVPYPAPSPPRLSCQTIIRIFETVPEHIEYQTKKKHDAERRLYEEEARYGQTGRRWPP